MSLKDFKFKIKPIEILIVIAVIVVISIVSIVIKNHIKSQELYNMTMADKTKIVDGDSVIQVEKPVENVVELNTNQSSNESNNSENVEQIVIKRGSTGVLRIPSIGVLAQITEGSSSDVLRDYVGVVEGSSRPGQIGNYALAAHNNIDTEIFKNLHNVENDALIYVYTQSKEYTYKVVDKYYVYPTQIEVLDKTNDKKEITLITCNFNASQRVIVKGILVGEKITRNM